MLILAVLPFAVRALTYEGADQMLELVNKERTALGLPTLCNNDKLMQSAKTQWGNCAQLGLTHGGDPPVAERASKVGFSQAAFAENVGQYVSQDIPTIMEAFMDEPGHRANIVGPYDMMGSWADKAADGNVYFVQHFAKTASGANETCMDGSSQAPSASSRASSSPSSQSTGAGQPSGQASGSPGTGEQSTGRRDGPQSGQAASQQDPGQQGGPLSGQTASQPSDQGASGQGSAPDQDLQWSGSPQPGQRRPMQKRHRRRYVKLRDVRSGCAEGFFRQCPPGRQ